ncbi:hypothetical protein DL96DRAFT_280950 [Flagelloscypha sp. PMI_526]|nr:hypothetical protein DL96DRAFT_280950 [Flagelloscypha sp. PMI_526]
MDFGGDAFTSVNSFYTAHIDVLGAATSSLASSSTGFAEFEQAISGFTDVAKTVITGLDALANLHPFVGVAVQAFKMVIQFDLQRRDNNKKVFVVKLQMQDMVTVLFELRTIRDPKDKGPDGITIEGRMQALVTNIANAIKEGGSAIDVYLGKGLISKTFKAMKYKTMLSDLAGKFEKFKEDIKFALQMHTAHGVDNANRKLDNQTQTLAALEAKLDMFMDKLDTARERDMKQFVASHDGPEAVLEDPRVLKALIQKSGEGIGAVTGGKLSKSEEDDLQKAKAVLTQDLQESIKEELEKNAVRFEGKLALVEEHLKDAMHDEGSRIIDALQDGAHNDIQNETLRQIWKDMGWKGSSVKARHFALALHDYFSYNFSRQEEPTSNRPSKRESRPKNYKGTHLEPESLDGVADEPKSAALTFRDPEDARALDAWALNFLTVTRVQSILEAIDDDGTGFITVREVNEFVNGQIEGWSLPFWIAFWGIGWHVSITIYRAKIYQILRQIYDLMPLVRPDNQLNTQNYEHHYAFARLERMLSSTQIADSEELGNDSILRRMVNEYMDIELASLDKSLKLIKYNLDSEAVVRLACGKNRIERWIFPVLYLLLRRHLQIFQLAKRYRLHSLEFEDASKSLATLDRMVYARIENLEAIFKQTYTNLEARFQNHAFGMFHGLYINRSQAFTTDSKIMTFYYEEFFWQHEATAEANDEPPLTILQFGPQAVISTYDDETHLHTAESNSIYGGTWSGHFMRASMDDESDIATTHGPVEMILYPGRNLFQCSGSAVTHSGKLYVEFKSGPIVPGMTEQKITLFFAYVTEKRTDVIRATGTFDLQREVLHGTWEASYESDVSRASHEAYYTRPPDPAPPKDPKDAADTDSDDGSEPEEGGPPTPISPAVKQTFYFTRTPPSVLPYRYSAKDLRSNPARARWRFACDAVLHGVRRKRFTWDYLLERKQAREMVVEIGSKAMLDLRERLPGSCGPSQGKMSDLRNILTRSSALDGRYYVELAEHKLMEMRMIFSLRCDICLQDTILRWRLTCIKCVQSQFSDALDICINCLGKSSTFLDFEHEPEHIIALLDGPCPSSNQHLKKGIESARETAVVARRDMRRRRLFLSATKSKKTVFLGRGPPCQSCNKKVRPPFWYCDGCADYFCSACFMAESRLRHDPSHSPVRFSKIKLDTDLSMEERMAALELRVGITDRRAVTIKSRLTEVEKAVNTRLDQMQAMLEQISARVGGIDVPQVEPPSEEPDPDDEDSIPGLS